MLENSVANWGMKRRAMPMIMPISCAGTPMRAKGESNRSKASVKSSVIVVSVTRLIPAIMSSSRQAIKRQVKTPCSLTRMNAHSK